MDADDDFAISGDMDFLGSLSAAPQPSTQAPHQILYFDLETVPDHEREHLFGLDPLPPLNERGEVDHLPPADEILAGPTDSIKLAVNGKIPPDEEIYAIIKAEQEGKSRKGVIEIFTKLLEAKNEIVRQHEARLKLLSTTPEYCRIAAICLQFGCEPHLTMVVAEECTGYGNRNRICERDILEAFWDHAARAEVIVGYNHIGFDLPVIFARSAINEFPAPRHIDLSPWGKDVIDVYLRRFGPRGNTSRERPGTLKELARLYGIQVPAEGVDGSQVYELMKTPEGRRKVAKYVESDVYVLHELFLVLSGYFWK